MNDTGIVGSDRHWAVVVALVANGALAWALSSLLQPGVRPAPPPEPIQVAWVAAPIPAVPPPTNVPTRAGPGADTRPPPVSVPSPASPPVADSAEANSAEAGTATSPLGEQAREWARRQTEPLFAAPDPLADRRVELPGTPGGRFRMREAPSLAGTLEAVGRVFGGPGYSTDPCPEVHRDVRALALQGDSRQLRDTLAYEKRFCR